MSGQTGSIVPCQLSGQASLGNLAQVGVSPTWHECKPVGRRLVQCHAQGTPRRRPRPRWPAWEPGATTAPGTMLCSCPGLRRQIRRRRRIVFMPFTKLRVLLNKDGEPSSDIERFFSHRPFLTSRSSMTLFSPQVRISRNLLRSLSKAAFA